MSTEHSSLTPEQATELLTLWDPGNSNDVFSLGAEPPLSVMLSLLVYKAEADGTDRDTYHKNPHHKQLRGFFTQARLAKILSAIRTGQADAEVRSVLDDELSRIGIGHLLMGGIPNHYFQRAYIKTRLLQCFDQEDLLRILGKIHAEPISQSPNHSPLEMLYAWIPLKSEDLFTIPFRDPFHERTKDYVKAGPYPRFGD